MSSTRAVIPKLTIEQYGGIEKFRWPHTLGVDVAFCSRCWEDHGAEAIALLLNPSNVAGVLFSGDFT
jgi:hypothetical protein